MLREGVAKTLIRSLRRNSSALASSFAPAWFLMTVLAWSAMRRHCDLAGSFASSWFAHLPNPFAETICNRRESLASPFW